MKTKNKKLEHIFTLGKTLGQELYWNHCTHHTLGFALQGPLLP
jgi:hypothetical protein